MPRYKIRPLQYSMVDAKFAAMLRASLELGILHVTLALALLLLSRPRGTVGDPSGTQCEQAPGREETCVCKTEGGVIDLTPFSNNDGTPR